MFLRFDWCDSGWWGWLLITNWWSYLGWLEWWLTTSDACSLMLMQQEEELSSNNNTNTDNNHKNNISNNNNRLQRQLGGAWWPLLLLEHQHQDVERGWSFLPAGKRPLGFHYLRRNQPICDGGNEEQRLKCYMDWWKRHWWGGHLEVDGWQFFSIHILVFWTTRQPWGEWGLHGRDFWKVEWCNLLLSLNLLMQQKEELR